MADIAVDSIGGNCPVQAEGTIDEVPFYFRARGTHWSLSVATSKYGVHGKDAFFHREQWSEEEFAAGWMSEDEARACIAKGAEIYLAAHPTSATQERAHGTKSEAR